MNEIIGLFAYIGFLSVVIIPTFLVHKATKKENETCQHDYVTYKEKTIKGIDIKFDNFKGSLSAFDEILKRRRDKYYISYKCTKCNDMHEKII